MSCGCNGSYDPNYDFDPADIWQEGRVLKSRKQRRCVECGVVIPVGSRHCFAKFLADGAWTLYVRCLTCAAFAEMFSTQHGYCPVWGELPEYDGFRAFHEAAKESEGLE